MILTRVALLILLVALSGVTACASRALPPPPEPDPMEMDDYVIGHSDNLEITVWKNPELSNTVVVRHDGKISLPLLDDVQAVGLTPLELKEVLTEGLREFVGDPEVTVTVTQMNSYVVYVLGEVARQGPIPLTRNLRVLDALSTAGGFGTFADRDDIRILRRSSKGIQEFRFDYDAYLKGQVPEANLLLQRGDTIVVPQ
jgi:polysaccharide export outer membrane protein